MKRFLKIEAMEHLTLHRFIALLHRFIALSLSTLYEFIQKSPCNSTKLSDTCKSKDDEVSRLCYRNDGNLTIFANTNHRFIASL
jgi:hypothetical protein